MINPRLMSISEFPKEIVRVVKDDPLILGRDPSNQLEVGDPAVSRKHCSVSEVSTDVFEIADLDSHNGTFVNGARVSRHTIQHGDRIRIGNSEFVFLTGPDQETGPLSSRSGSDVMGSQLKTMSLDRSGLPTGDSWVGRMARDLTAFFKIANMINSTRNVQALLSELLELICEVIPASRAAILLQPNPSEELSPPCMWNRKDFAPQDMLIRDELVQQAIWEHCAVVATAAAETTSAEHVLCVPLVAVERILGVI